MAAAFEVTWAPLGTYVDLDLSAALGRDPRSRAADLQEPARSDARAPPGRCRVVRKHLPAARALPALALPPSRLHSPGLQHRRGGLHWRGHHRLAYRRSKLPHALQSAAAERGPRTGEPRSNAVPAAVSARQARPQATPRVEEAIRLCGRGRQDRQAPAPV